MISSADGLSLEAGLDRADGGKATIVICHPHPKMGGTMNAPLLLALRDEMVGRDWNVLRFNFRGIGSSEGISSTGGDEVRDALGVLGFARTMGLPVGVAGWSFGAAVAVRAAARADDLLGCVAIAPAVRPKEGITEGIPPGVAPRIPVLVVIGANDDQVSPAHARAWAEENSAEFEEVPAANHFFWARYDRLAGLVAGWLDEKL